MSLYHQKLSKRQKLFNFWCYHKIMGLILLFVIIIGSFFYGYNQYQKDLMNRFAVKGVLINQSNGYIDFVSLANSGQKFVYIRASQGSMYTDDNYVDNFQRSQGSGMQVGVYHVFSTQSDINAQIKNFTHEVGSNYGSLPPMVDVPDDLSNVSVKHLSTFLFRIHVYYDTKVLLRSNYDVFQRLNGRLKNDVQYFSPRFQNKRGNFIELQNNHAISLDGTTVLVNQVAFNGNKKEWQKYLLKIHDH
jgi:lysozyme